MHTVCTADIVRKNLSDSQLANLKTLANYLLSLPADYKKFDMSNYAEINYRKQISFSDFHMREYQSAFCFPDVSNNENECGTSACAVGHGPAAGIPVGNAQKWSQYCITNFIDNESNATTSNMWDWCFSARWGNFDNSVHGAARRILYMIEYGVPDSWRINIFFDNEWVDAVNLYQ